MISIIVPLYNKQDCIFKTVKSVLEQEDVDFELIIVDDGSTDKSLSVIETLKDYRIKIFKKQNGGPSSARNYGIVHAQGDWIIFLDADDYFEPRALNHVQDVILNKSNCDFFCFNHYIEFESQKKIYSTNYIDGIIQNNFYCWCNGSLMPRAGAAVFKRNLLLSHLFNEQLKRYEDAESLFEIMRISKVYECSIPIMTYNLDRTSASKARKDISEDFIGHLSPKGKSAWEQYALYQLYCQGCRLYPEDVKRLYHREDFYTLKVRFLDYYLRLKTQGIRSFSPIPLLKYKVKIKIKNTLFKVFPELHIVESPGRNLIEHHYDFKTCGKHVKIYPPAHISGTSIGDYTYIAQNSYVSHATIGKCCSIGPNLICGWGIHPLDGISTHPMFFSTLKQNGMTFSLTDKVEERKPIVIGNDVFIGANVTILDGVSIGDGAVIGAGAVVSKDIPPYAVAVGCPIKVIRYRFPEETREKLLKIKWWDWDEDRLRMVEQMEFDVDKFVKQRTNSIHLSKCKS